jgi:ABC-type Fe3+/spermidine/putrescine transport system ATPase subunit
VTLGGRVVNEVPAYRRNTGMVFQSYALFPHMSVFDNVAFGLKVRRVGGSDIARRVRRRPRPRAARGLGAASHPPALGRASSSAWPSRAPSPSIPLVLLMDEPLSNLDAQLRRQMRVELRRLQRQVGITTIFVTHDQEEALTLSDRLVVMNRGRIEQAGTPIELYRKPRTPFVAQFLGHPNFLFGTVAGRRGTEVTVQLGAQQVHAFYESPVDHGAPVAVVLRAESAALHKTAPPARVNALRGNHRLCGLPGDEQRIRGHARRRYPAPRDRADGERPALLHRRGRKVVVSWAPEDSIVLPGSRESMPDLVS